MPDLVFYPYQLEDGSYIDKISGKSLINYGSIDKYPTDITPYKTPKNYIGGGGMYKSYSNRAYFVYANWNILNGLKDFTIYFWTYQIASGTNGFIFTLDDTNGNVSSFGFGKNFLYYYTGNEYYKKYSFISNRWVLHEYSFKQSGSNYIVTGFYDGKKQFTQTFASNYIKHNKYYYGNWSYPANYASNGFYGGYVYDLSIYDDILHTENYDIFPITEMHYNINKNIYIKDDTLYGMI